MEVTIDPLWAVIMVLFGIVLLLAKQVYNFNKKLKRLNVPVVESRVAQVVYQIAQATENLNNAMIQSQNIQEETNAYYQRIKYILDHSGWTAVRLQNLSNAIREVGEGTNDTHITLEIEADNPNQNAPGESKKSESAGAEYMIAKTSQTDDEEEDEDPNLPIYTQKQFDDALSTITRIHRLIYFFGGMAFGIFAYWFIYH